MRHLISVSFALILALAGTVVCGAATRHVPQQYATIQAAIDAAAPGDKISVDDGVYFEHVVIPIQNIEIVGEDGAIVDGGPTGRSTAGAKGIYVAAPGATVRGMTIRNFDAGMYIDQPGSRIQANTITACNDGIIAAVFGDGVIIPAKTTIDHNGVNGNALGIVLDNCQNVTVTHNVVDSNTEIGIVLQTSTVGCTVTHNEANDNGIYGIFVEFTASGNVLSHNKAFGNVIFDAVDEILAQNLWIHNKFGTSSGI